MISATGPTGNGIGLYIASQLLHTGVAARASTRSLERRIDPAA